MPTLFNTLTVRVTTSEGRTQTEFIAPSGATVHTIPAGEPQPRFGKQRSIMLNNTYYSLTWSLTPSTPAIK